MKTSPIETTLQLVENYTECWKQLNHYLQLARSKKFESDDEAQFLEIKSVVAQQLEVVLATVRCQYPTREDVHKLLSETPSLRYLSEVNEDERRAAENRWHRIYIGWQSMLGQLKAKQLEKPAKGFNWFFFLGKARA